MPELLKDRYNYESVRRVALDIQSVYGEFAVDGFLAAAIDETWDNLELKDRIAKIGASLGKYLPADYKAAVGIIDRVVMNYGDWLNGFVAFFPVFVELYGRDEKNWELSMASLAQYTQFASAEFAVRWFIINHEERMMAQMYAWSRHESEHVRRLASEGCRPQLPWGQALNSFKKDPSPILPILEQLKTDSSLFVRKSVANNLNDISKTHPELVLKIARNWYGKNAATDWIVKHGCRTLLKKGNREALALFGYDDTTSIEVRDFTLGAAAVSIGEELTFSFTVFAKAAAKVRLEYGLDYVKSGGKRSRKIFQISAVSLPAAGQKVYVKKHSFADVSVRRHYPGSHSLTLIVNGVERGTLDFDVTVTPGEAAKK